MEHWYHIYFEDKIEYTDVEDALKKYPIGQLLFSFLDVDWDSLVSEISELRQLFPDEALIRKYYLKLKKGFSNAHPFLAHMIGRLTLDADPDTLKGLYIRVSELARFKVEISGTIYKVLDTDGEYNELTPIQRYHLLQLGGSALSVQAQKMYDLVFIQHRISENGKRVFGLGKQEITPKLVGKVANSDLSAYTFYCSDDIRALVFLEFEYMCTAGCVIRKCGYCGRYFLPFSSVALYCDRPVDDVGRTCKDIAAKEKYNRKVNSDAAKKLYTRLNNAYQMRCSRAPSVYRVEDRFAWQDRAKQLLKEVEVGDLSYEDFEAAIQLPDTK